MHGGRSHRFLGRLKALCGKHEASVRDPRLGEDGKNGLSCRRMGILIGKDENCLGAVFTHKIGNLLHGTRLDDHVAHLGEVIFSALTQIAVAGKQGFNGGINRHRDAPLLG